MVSLSFFRPSFDIVLPTLRFLHRCLCLPFVPASSPSRDGNVAVYVFDINQPSLPTLFFEKILFLCLFLSYSPFNYISFHKFSQQFSAFLHATRQGTLVNSRFRPPSHCGRLAERRSWCARADIFRTFPSNPRCKEKAATAGWVVQLYRCWLSSKETS